QIELSEFTGIFSQNSKQSAMFDFVVNECTKSADKAKNYDILKIFSGELIYKKSAYLNLRRN
ncbi:MAG: hypothetical protein Hyperionvirus40_1, partial [Hyperionvirus sp.]